MGEPAGIGPELIGRIWAARHIHKLPPLVYIGAIDALKQACPDIEIHEVDVVDDHALDTDALPAINIPLAAPNIPGTLNPDNGGAVISAIDKAVSLALSGDASAVVTAPIHKAALYQAGFTAPGHTEYLARLCGMPETASVMMLAAEDLRVVPVTVHIGLKEVAQTLTADQIIHVGMTTHRDLQSRFGIEKPRIAAAALNPHAGEDGAMGMEEATHITPAIWALKDHGIHVDGPLPADTLFHAEARKNYDTVICMYHDQALI
ncbi:MAG: 4-hydroxythreonine-4-phosphate dehydrogenase PdxA, partial [Alphaproteobacteria bacterium]|nr:4-hydroxythreonine-4-phosphate dehydrogenase PdxA [Alphaproteobacteria bacterium]